MPLTSDGVPAAPTHESSETPTTREVLSEMAGGAAIGAVTGGAKAIMPTEVALGAVAGAAKAMMPTETEHAKTKKRGKRRWQDRKTLPQLGVQQAVQPPAPLSERTVFGTKFARFSDGPKELSEWHIENANVDTNRNKVLYRFGDSGWSSRCSKSMERLHDVGTERDRAGNRKLFYDQYVTLLLMYFFNPALDSLRALQQATGWEKTRQKLGIEPTSLGSLSEAARVFDADLLGRSSRNWPPRPCPCTTGREAEALEGTHRRRWLGLHRAVADGLGVVDRTTTTAASSSTSTSTSSRASRSTRP